MSGVLDGYRVIELAEVFAGPSAACTLGEMGAEVIKVERRITGESLRGAIGMGSHSMQLPDKRGASFVQHTRNKKFITVDITKGKGQAVIYRLVEKSDAIIVAFRQPAMKAINLDYETVKKHNPRIIYAFLSGFGPKGPEADAGALDFEGQARSGLMFTLGWDDLGAVASHVGQVDYITGVLTAFGIVAALLARERYGIGQRVDTSLLAGGMVQAFHNLACAALGPGVPRHNPSSPWTALRNYYRCADDKWIMYTLSPPDRHWPAFAKAFGLEEYLDKPGFRNYNEWVPHMSEVTQVVAQALAKLTRDEVIRRSKEAGLVYSPVHTIREALEDEQVRDNYLVDGDVPGLGKVAFPGNFIQFSETPMKTWFSTAELGQDTEQVLLDVAGYTWDEIVALRNEEVI